MIKKFYGGSFVNKEDLESQGINYPIKIEYYKICDNTQNKDIMIYGIEIIKTEYRDKNIITENKEVLNITREEKEINNILDKLKKYQVTPVSANYVIEDLSYKKASLYFN